MYPIKPRRSWYDVIVGLVYLCVAFLLMCGYIFYQMSDSIVHCSRTHDVYSVWFYLSSMIDLMHSWLGGATVVIVLWLLHVAYDVLTLQSALTRMVHLMGWMVLIIGVAMHNAWYVIDVPCVALPGGLMGRAMVALFSYEWHLFGGVLISLMMLSGVVMIVGCKKIMSFIGYGAVLHYGWSGLQFFVGGGYRCVYAVGAYIKKYAVSLMDVATFVEAGYMIPTPHDEYEILLTSVLQNTHQDSVMNNGETVMRGATVIGTLDDGDRGITDQGLSSDQSVVKKDEKDEKDCSVHEQHPYQLPPIQLFKAHLDGVRDTVTLKKELQVKVGLLEEKLGCFGIKGSVVQVTVGPVVALFEYKPDIEIKISKIVSLEDDLALALQAHTIRIIAPIPGKSVVGFEIAHHARQPVLLADALHSDTYAHFAGSLPLVLGQDIIGNQLVVDLARMPHLLVAGSTGAGKSVALNAMLISLLCAKKPDQLRLVLIDPKRLEFGCYTDIPHLLFPIVTSTGYVVPVLRWVVSHMEERYAVMSTVGARAIDDYNGKVDTKDQYPYIVVVIDELADLMMTVGKDAQDLIARIAQMARAAGIHLIVATQRPSVDVITGLIKVNFPSRISFRVTSRVDSRTILDVGGAEKLLGKGDMLFQDAQSAHVKRVHGAYVSDQEIARVVSYIRVQGVPNYVQLGVENEEGALDGDEQLFEQVVAFVKTVELVSISQIQRHFKIGYNRSARIMNLLEMRGLVLPQASGKMRRVVK